MKRENKRCIDYEAAAPSPIAARRIRTTADGLVGAMAVVLANTDENRDYLEFFMPFVADRLRKWPEHQPVAPGRLSTALCDGWGFPSVPTAVSKLLLQRARKDGLVRVTGGQYYPNRARLLGMPDMADKKREMLAELNALADAVVAYAWEVHALDWSPQQALKALDRLTDEFGAELAIAKREGRLAAEPHPDSNDLLTIVYGFALRALERDEHNFNRLVAMVQGTMIANALYFEDTRKLPNRLAELRVYIDTTPLLRGLGLASSDVVLATREMLALIRSFKVPMFVFSHTLDELTAILERIAVALERGHEGISEQGQFSGLWRETMNAATDARMTPGSMRMLIAEIEHRLESDLGVRLCDTPRRPAGGQIDEDRLSGVLSELIPYASKGSLERDVESLAAVDRLRGSTRPRDLGRARALFITANGALADASQAFFESAKSGAPIPHCITDAALTAQLWVVSSERKPGLPRHLLIADCYSALAPSQRLWARWVSHIIALRKQEKLTEEQLQTLIYHQQIKTLLFEVVHGNPANVNDTAIAEVLARYEAEVREPVERAALAARAATEQARQETHAARLAAIAEREAFIRRLAELTDARRAAWRRHARRWGGFAGTLPIVAAFALCATGGYIQGKFWWATSVTVLVLACAGVICWGLRKGWKAAAAILISAGGLSSLWANVFGVADSANKAPGATHPQAHVISRDPPK